MASTGLVGIFKQKPMRRWYLRKKSERSKGVSHKHIGKKSSLETTAGSKVLGQKCAWSVDEIAMRPAWQRRVRTG